MWGVFLVLLVLAYVLHMGSFGLILLGLLFFASMMSAPGQKSSSWNDQAHEMGDEGEAARQKKTKMDGASMIGQYTRLCVKAEPDSLN